jgi:hypothetical protein
MSEIAAPCVYFARPGTKNTERTLELAHERAKALDIRKVLVASTSGATGARAVEVLRGLDVIVVTHSTGFSEPDTQQLTDGNRSTIEATGATLLTCQHAFGGVGRAVRKKLGTYQIDEIIAYTLRTFSEGIKVTAELALMAADAGLVRTDEAVISVAGSGGGADTAAVLKPTNAQTFFDLEFLEIICMPSPNHPQSPR